MRFIVACRVFFAVLLNAALAQQVKQLLEGRQVQSVEKQPSQAAAPVLRSHRSDALTLLATLQREARLVDLVQEPLENYSDAQIGAAARDVLRDCARVLARLFALKPLVEQSEGAEIEIPAGFSPERFRLTGNVSGQPPLRGQLVHHGWEASNCQLPSWTGSPEAANVIAPAEVEVH